MLDVNASHFHSVISVSHTQWCFIFFWLIVTHNDGGVISIRNPHQLPLRKKPNEEKNFVFVFDTHTHTQSMPNDDDAYYFFHNNKFI